MIITLKKSDIEKMFGDHYIRLPGLAVGPRYPKAKNLIFSHLSAFFRLDFMTMPLVGNYHKFQVLTADDNTMEIKIVEIIR